MAGEGRRARAGEVHSEAVRRYRLIGSQHVLLKSSPEFRNGTSQETQFELRDICGASRFHIEVGAR
jgi:hypothetical protein